MIGATHGKRRFPWGPTVAADLAGIVDRISFRSPANMFSKEMFWSRLDNKPGTRSTGFFRGAARTWARLNMKRIFSFFLGRVVEKGREVHLPPGNRPGATASKKRRLPMGRTRLRPPSKTARRSGPVFRRSRNPQGEPRAISGERWAPCAPLQSLTSDLRSNSAAPQQGGRPDPNQDARSMSATGGPRRPGHLPARVNGLLIP